MHAATRVAGGSGPKHGDGGDETARRSASSAWPITSRETARDTVDLLRAHGVTHVVLLTGDHEAAARALAEAVGVDEYRAALLPEDKVDRRRGAAARATARWRWSATASTTRRRWRPPTSASRWAWPARDAALETADVALMADELLKIPYALRLSRATTRNIRANIAFSLVLKGAFLVMAVAGVATLWMAVLADMGASLIVIANALRLLRE